MELINLGLLALLFIGIVWLGVHIANRFSSDEYLDLDFEDEEPITLLGVVLPKEEKETKKNEKK